MMNYLVSCCIKGCGESIRMAHPLPSNLRFVCPTCEDAIFHSLLERLVKAGLVSDGAVAQWHDVLTHWRAEAARQQMEQVALETAMAKGNGA